LFFLLSSLQAESRYTNFSIYHNDFVGPIPKKQTFGNNVGKSQPIRTKFGRPDVHRSRGDNVQEILDAIGIVGGKTGAQISPVQPVLLSSKPDTIS